MSRHKAESPARWMIVAGRARSVWHAVARTSTFWSVPSLYAACGYQFKLADVEVRESTTAPGPLCRLCAGEIAKQAEVASRLAANKHLLGLDTDSRG